MYSPNQVFMIKDYETYSEANLKLTGSYEYSKHPSTEILCVSWMVGTRKQLERKLKNKEKAQSWAPKRVWNKHRKDLRKGRTFAKLVSDPSIIKVAHNSMFEQAITRHVLPRHLGKYIGKAPFIIPHEQYLCTAVQAASHAIPRSLDGATEALKLDHVKDKEGHRLMMSWAKPKKPSKADPSTRYTKDFDRLVEYCEHDIYAEVGLFIGLNLPTPSERSLWLFDQIINFRGIRVDRDLVKKTQILINESKREMTEELRRLTKGAVQTAGQKKVIHAWLKTKGVELPDLKAKTVDDAIKDKWVQGTAKRVLQLCQKLNKTSLKKYTAFIHHSNSDGRIRFSLNFNATVHGRWGGAGVQPHNFPRGTLKYKDAEGKEHDLAPFAAELIKKGTTLGMLELLFGDPTEVFVSCLRCMIIPDEGKQLYVSDFAAIEARVLFWLSNHEKGCKAFRDNQKMYEELAMVIFNLKRIEDVLKDQRFVGKQAFLGSGYGMGWKKFQKTCLDFGMVVSDDVAKKAIKAYRELHEPVVKLWNNLERVAIKAVENPGKTFKINNTEWFIEKKFLVCRLPSGRCLYYYGPEVKYQKTPWGDSKPALYHWSVDSKTRKWVFGKTWGGILTQNCVGGISRDLLAAGMKRHEKAGYEVELTVHDEIIASMLLGKGSVEEFNRLMARLPKWAKGCPVACEGWSGSRYRK